MVVALEVVVAAAEAVEVAAPAVVEVVVVVVVAAVAVAVVVVVAPLLPLRQPPLRHLPGMFSILHPIYIMGIMSYS